MLEWAELTQPLQPQLPSCCLLWQAPRSRAERGRVQHLTPPPCTAPARFKTRGLSLSSWQPFPRPWGHPSLPCSSGRHSLCPTRAPASCRDSSQKLHSGLETAERRQAQQTHSPAPRTLLPEGRGADSPVHVTHQHGGSGKPLSLQSCPPAPSHTEPVAAPGQSRTCHTGSAQPLSVLGNAFAAAAATPKVRPR